jgi:hypothetical protein
MATKLTKKEKGFVKDFIDTGNGTKAVLNNYDTEDYDIASSIASQNLRKLKIQQALSEHAEPAESMIFNLSQEAKQEMVRLNASKDIMDRAGYKPIDKSISSALNLNVEARILDNPEIEALNKEYEERMRAIYVKGRN